MSLFAEVAFVAKITVLFTVLTAAASPSAASRAFLNQGNQLLDQRL